MRTDLVWYHVIWHTHNSWLPGDPRGFRNHDHRIHSSGDYRDPPPKGEHEGLLRYNQARGGLAIRLPGSVHATVAEAILDAIVRRECSAAALSVAAEHVHLLARLPANYGEAQRVVGRIKAVSSLAIRSLMPGTVWSRGGMLKRISDPEHWQSTSRYITNKQERTAFVWECREEKSTAPAVASTAVEDRDATAGAVNPSQKPTEADPRLFRQSDAVEVRRVTNRGKGGRAVFARRDIAEGETIERVPVLLVPRTQVFGPGDVAQRAARISWYVFEWLSTKRAYVALSLGYGSIYNHGDAPNAMYDMELPDVMVFSAIRAIAAGEEITISYAGAAGVMKDLGFEAETNPPQAAD